MYVRSDNLAGVVIADHEYPQRVAHTLINKVSSGTMVTCVISASDFELLYTEALEVAAVD